MIQRVCVYCPGCNETITLRISVGLMPRQPFYYVCSNCNSATRGALLINDEEFDLDLEEGSMVEDIPETEQVYTLDPLLPTLAGARSMVETGGSPFIFNFQILGDRTVELQDRISTYLGVIDIDWNRLSRLTRFFLDSNWDRFDQLFLEIMNQDLEGTPNWSRYDVLYKLYDAFFAPILAQSFLLETRKEWNSFFLPYGSNARAISEYQDSLINDQAYLELRESLFNCLQLYIECGDSILPGLVVDMYPREHSTYGDLRIYRDDYPKLRDLYIQCFEACNHALTFIVEVINVVNRGDPNDYIQPAEMNNCPNNRNQFNRLNAQSRAYFLAELPEWNRIWGETLD